MVTGNEPLLRIEPASAKVPRCGGTYSSCAGRCLETQRGPVPAGRCGNLPPPAAPA